MKTILLRLEGLLQSWGTQSRFEERDTDTEPSKSGVLGLVSAAMGMKRDNDAMLSRLAALRMAVRVDREGTLMRDYHTAGGGRFRGEEHAVVGTGGEASGTVVTKRYYLADASFLVALQGKDDALVAAIDEALQDPVWPLFLGRKSCAPSVPVHVPGGLLVDDAAQALRQYPWLRPSKDSPERLRLVMEASPGDGRRRNDVPVSFRLFNRVHQCRYVTTDWVPTEGLPNPKET